MSKIEWTDTTCVHTIVYGTNPRRRTIDRSKEGGLHRSRVHAPRSRRREVVYRVQSLARRSRVQHRQKSLGWIESPVPRMAQEQICSQAQEAPKGTDVCSATRRRRSTGPASRQLLCRERSACPSQHAAMPRLRAPMGAGRASA